MYSHMVEAGVLRSSSAGLRFQGLRDCTAILSAAGGIVLSAAEQEPRAPYHVTIRWCMGPCLGCIRWQRRSGLLTGLVALRNAPCTARLELTDAAVPNHWLHGCKTPRTSRITTSAGSTRRVSDERWCRVKS